MATRNLIGDRIELSDGEATATLDPAHGGMLVSLRVAGRELLLARDHDSGPIPNFGCFLMAPWVAEMSEGRLEFRGRRFQLPPNHGRHAIHGLVARGPWEVEFVGARVARMRRKLSEPWPFGGEVVQDVSLDASGLTLVAEIQAGHRAMPVGVGWHPWFDCADPEVVRVGVDASLRLELDNELLPTGRSLPVEGDNDLRGAPILGPRSLDTVYVGATSPALLSVPGLDVQIHFDPTIAVVVVYTSPGAVCIEPWSSWTDAARMDGAGFPSGVEILEPSETLRRWTRWDWTRTGSPP